MMPAGGGGFLLYLHAQVRRASGSGAGDTVEVALAFDAEYFGGLADPMPAWFMEALKRAPAARSGREALTPSLQKEILRYLGR
ncbi:DUF1905 domain-containing protein [Rhizobium sullae]|uniref:Uncharacterized protein DUF1905 n=1 Tax=Rhizobium sullae TaxID=50338 RepID=A0A4R3Q9W0_RHISU|nr:DUF1905 domain-containing protein [Rhizobium sullae]TCU18233.1 uncharacterized protein DUF1905 [Rhizobium sullae]